MEESKEWTVQVLDAEGNVRYQAVIHGTEKRARALCLQLEERRRKDADTFDARTKEKPKQAKRWF